MVRCKDRATPPRRSFGGSCRSGDGSSHILVARWRVEESDMVGRTSYKAFVLVASVSLLLAACGSGGSGLDEPDTTDGGVTEDPIAETPSADGPRRGGVVETAVGTDTRTNLDPHTSTFSGFYHLLSPSYNQLLGVSGDPSDQLELVPELAEDWEVSDDGLIYTFHLRDDVVWHDIPPVNGRGLVADDVVATYERIIDIGLQGSWFDVVTDIEASDDHTVVFTLSEPYSPFLEAVAHHYNVIIPREGA